MIPMRSARVAKSTHKHRGNGWIFSILIPTAYLIVELGFNYQLIDLSAGTVQDDVLSGLEFWGRVISGVGLGLILFRLMLNRPIHRLAALLLCVGIGITVMWNVQRELTDALVAAALPEDKVAAVALSALARPAGDGELKTLRGDAVLLDHADAFERKTVMALFPAAALHIENRDAQLQHWLGVAGFAQEPTLIPAHIQENAYRNLIVPPIAIGLSIFFALFNLALLVGSVANKLRKGLRPIVFSTALAALIAVSLFPSNPLTNSQGYRNSLAPGLWNRKPALAMLVEWSVKAAPAWWQVSSFSHRFLLLGYPFQKPQWPGTASN